MAETRRLLRSAKPRRAAVLATAALLFALPSVASAASDDPEIMVRNADGRLRGYNEMVVLEGGDTPLLPYLAFVGLTLFATVFLFKDAKRTHLD